MNLIAHDILIVFLSVGIGAGLARALNMGPISCGLMCMGFNGWFHLIFN